MKITFVCPMFDMGGGQRVIALYADQLDARGHDVVVVAPPPRRQTPREVLRSIVKRREFRWKAKKAPSHFDALPHLTQVLERNRPVSTRDVPDADVVIATWWETAEWVAGLPDRKGSKVYFIQGHEVFPYLPIDRVEATLRSDFHKITISQRMIDILRELYDDPDVTLVPNGVDVRQFRTLQRSKNPTPTVGFVFSPGPVKGADVALKAYSIAAARVPGLRLVAFGAAPPCPQVKLASRMEFTRLPSQRQIPRIYGQCDAWLFPSRNEGFGLPILEAMACRTPVIGTPTGAAPELLRQGGGVLVPMDDPEAMAEAIVAVVGLEDPEWRALSDAALNTARRNSWDASIDMFEAALEAAAASSIPTFEPSVNFAELETVKARQTQHEHEASELLAS